MAVDARLVKSAGWPLEKDKLKERKEDKKREQTEPLNFSGTWNRTGRFGRRNRFSG